MLSCIIIGIKGFTGKEFIRLIKKHCYIKYIYIILRKNDNSIKNIHNELIFLKIRNIKIFNNIKINLLISCLPNNNFQFLLKNINFNKFKLIDLSADFRFKNKNFDIIYKKKHCFNKIQNKFLYGYLEEIKNLNITTIQSISNPGCYVNLTLNIIFPLFRKNIVNFHTIIINAINGTSGIGRKINEKFLHYYQHDNIKAYSLEGHKHTLEITNAISKFTKKYTKISLCTAHGNFTRGIYIFIICKTNLNLICYKKHIFNFLNWFNKKNKFIKIFNLSNLIIDNYKYHSFKLIFNTNLSYISFNISNLNNEIRFIGSLDNLIKGAVGTAIENINLLFNLLNFNK